MLKCKSENALYVPPLSLADNKASSGQQKQKSQVEAFIHLFFLIPQETLKPSVFHAIKLNNYND
jgi:hypothetical protein